MQQDSRDQELPAETRKDVKEHNRHFRIVKLEERIAPGGRPRPWPHTRRVPHICNNLLSRSLVNHAPSLAWDTPLRRAPRGTT
jgi:hypothetical protein